MANKILRHAITPEQGIAFYEVPASDMPFPESQAGSLVIFDYQNYLHGLILDAATGKWFDCTTRQGPAGSNINKYFTGVSGENFDRSVRFKEDRGTYEHEKIRNLENHLYVRPTDEINRSNKEGYDDAGYPEGFKAALNIYVDGEPVAPNGKMRDIPLSGNIKCDKKLEGNRIQAELVTNRGDHYIVNRQAYYAEHNKAAAPANRVSAELTFQESLAGVLYWLDFYNGSLINRYNGAACTASGISAVTDPIGTSRALRFSGEKTFGTATLGDGSRISVWSTGTPIITIGGSSIALTQYDDSFGDWSLYSGDAAAISGSVKIQCSGDLFDLRVYSTSITDEELSYYYDDIADNNGGIVIP